MPAAPSFRFSWMLHKVSRSTYRIMPMEATHKFKMCLDCIQHAPRLSKRVLGNLTLIWTADADSPRQIYVLIALNTHPGDYNVSQKLHVALDGGRQQVPTKIVSRCELPIVLLILRVKFKERTRTWMLLLLAISLLIRQAYLPALFWHNSRERRRQDF